MQHKSRKIAFLLRKLNFRKLSQFKRPEEQILFSQFS